MVNQKRRMERERKDKEIRAEKEIKGTAKDVEADKP